ncbi:MAG TPA: 1-acyl-sn-glycerol-3-phosphate acyltransferase [Salinivirgaceae bacterium]|nr:1-acyl-sn-glycerol-3-phosphate acyltransferase [Salinivirgaceae bacterium]HQA76530.1 1-acyl-sn-glycerol-3-phosphate acyltransferase [Salinivirgaceae bacterium]
MALPFKQRFGKFLAKLFGWKLIGSAPKEQNFIMAVLPHTSYLDFLVGKMFNLYLGFPIHFLIKKEAFFFPLGCILKAVGGVPINRKKPGTTMVQIIDRFQNSKQFVLVIAPEGTRKKVTKWKPGFWYFATKANVPIVPIGLNYKTKTCYIDKAMYMTGNQEDDFAKLKSAYSSLDLHAKHPEKTAF